MLQYVKRPRSIAEYSLMKGVTDFSNLKQFDLFETSYGFLTVCAVPQYMSLLAAKNPVLKDCQDALIQIMEGEFKGLDGIPDITADGAPVSNGANEIQLINNVQMDTSIQISMNYYERSGAPLTKYLKTYLTTLKDPYSKAKTYGGLIADGTITDPGPDYETFTFLYYVTDNTCRKLEQAYLFANAQPTQAPMSTLYNMTRGDITYPEIQLTFNAFPIIGDEVNMMAAQMLEYQLTSTGNDRLVLDSTDFAWNVFSNKVTGGYSRVASKMQSVGRGTVEGIYK